MSTFERQLRVACPASPEDALASLAGSAPWPGPSLLWIVLDGKRYVSSVTSACHRRQPPCAAGRARPILSSAIVDLLSSSDCYPNDGRMLGRLTQRGASSLVPVA